MYLPCASPTRRAQEFSQLYRAWTRRQYLFHREDGTRQKDANLPVSLLQLTFIRFPRISTQKVEFTHIVVRCHPKMGMISARRDAVSPNDREKPQNRT